MEYCNNKEENSKNKPHLIESYFTVMEVLCRPGAPTATDLHIHVTSDATPRCELNQGHSRQPALAPGLLPLHLAVPT